MEIKHVVLKDGIPSPNPNYEQTYEQKVKENIMRDISRKKLLSDKYLFSCAEIAVKNDVEKSVVRKIAKEIGINRGWFW